MTMVAASSTAGSPLGARCRRAAGPSRPAAALRSREPRLDPLDALHGGGRVHAFGLEGLDVLDHDRLLGGVVPGSADRDRLDRLVAVPELHLDPASRRIPFEVLH